MKRKVSFLPGVARLLVVRHAPDGDVIATEHAEGTGGEEHDDPNGCVSRNIGRPS